MDQPSTKILLVEDNPADALLVRASLEGATFEKFEVHVSTRLGAAIDRAKSEQFDLMVLDLGLPDSQGLQTFVRTRSALPQMPIILLSGLEDEEVAIHCVQSGAQDYLLKGFTLMDVLPRAIRYALERHRFQVRIERVAAELRTKNAELEEELQMAREIQQALLPSHSPRFLDLPGSHDTLLRFSHHYRPATALSGDFFTVLRLSESKAGVLICDVMGHGVRAALIGALARGLIDHLRLVAAEPGEFLTCLNRGLADILKNGEIEAFASAFYLVADVAKQQVTYASAGHPSALLVHRDEGLVNPLRVGGHARMPLGLSRDTVYPEARAPLRQRDSIVLHTDGLCEEENEAGEQFGQQRLIEAVGSHLAMQCEDMLPDLVREAQRFSGHEQFADDVCLVGIDVTTGSACN